MPARPSYRPPVTWETAESADGPALAAWLDRELSARMGGPRGGNIAAVYGDAFARRLYGWRHGENASFWTVDRYLMKLGIHPQDVPRHVWRDKAAKDR